MKPEDNFLRVVEYTDEKFVISNRSNTATIYITLDGNNYVRTCQLNILHHINFMPEIRRIDFIEDFKSSRILSYIPLQSLIIFIVESLGYTMDQKAYEDFLAIVKN